MSEFATKLTKLCLLILAIAALLTVAVSILIFLFPHLLGTILTYAVGTGLLLLGLILAGSLCAAVLR